MSRTAYLRSNDLPADAALAYLDDEGNRTAVLHLPVRGNGDGGAYSTVGDLTLFWQALLEGRIVSSEMVTEMMRPRADVPEEDKRCGLGLFLLEDRDALVIEGYDAGASFRSTHDPATKRTVSVLGNSSEGGWTLISGFGADAWDAV